MDGIALDVLWAFAFVGLWTIAGWICDGYEKFTNRKND